MMVSTSDKATKAMTCEVQHDATDNPIIAFFPPFVNRYLLSHLASFVRGEFKDPSLRGDEELTGGDCPRYALLIL
jgi:hypothetical protein